MTSNTVNISTGSTVKMSNLRQSLNIFGDQISLGSTLGLRTSFPATGATNVALSSYRNYINAYSPLLCLDANIYTSGSGSWTDQSGNGYNFTVNNSAYSSFNGINYMNFTSTSATITSGTNIPLTFANGATFIAFSEILNNTANYRTLFSGIGGDPHVIINSGTNTLGVLDQTGATGFYGASTPTPGAFTITSIPSFNTNFNMLVLQQNTSSPYFQVKYNGQSGNNYYTNTTNSAAQLKSGLGYIGGVANAQNWGNVGLVLVYNSILTNNQISDIYNRFAARFIYNMPPVTNGMIGYYTGESWTGTQWTDLSGANNATTIVNTANISLYNNIRKDSNGTLYQALNGFNYLAGANNSGITFPVSLNNYTIIWVARYAGINLQTGSGAGAIGRIFDGQQSTNNWLSGFYNGFSGVAEHNGTFITQNTQSKYGSNWIIGVDQTNLFRANGTNLTLTNPSATYNNFNMTINNGNYLATQPSDWMVATVIIYNRELSLSEILTMETWLATKYNLTSSLVSHQLNKISALGSQACVGAYGLYRLSITYTGPTIKVVRSDGIAMDFYADINGNLGIAPNGTGTSLLNWLQVTSSTIGNIAIWYDQSGAGNNATQSIASQQPSIDAVNNLISFKTNLSSSTGLYCFILPSGTVPYNTGSPSPYTVITKHNSAVGAGTTSTLPALLSSGSTSTGFTNDFYINTTTANYATNSYVNSWYGNDYYTTSSTLLNGNVVSFNYSGGAYNTRGIYVNGTLQNVSYYGSASGVLNSTPYNNYIGNGHINNYFNGELYYLYIFKSQLSYTDQNILEQTPFYVAALTGISATSIAATSVTLQWTQTYGYQYSIVSWSYSGTNYTSSQISYGTNIFNGFTGGNILLPNVSYTFTVTPYYYINTTGGPSNSASPVAITSSAVTSSSIITLPTVTLPATQALIFPTVTANSVTINWNAAGTPPTFSYVIVSWASSTSTNQNGTSYTTPSNPLTANTQYTFTVTPYNSAASPVAGTAQSASIYTLGTITSATASATGRTVSISWTGSYNTVTISWTGSGSGTYTTSSSATSSYQVTLSAGTYNFSVTPYNAANAAGTSVQLSNVIISTQYAIGYYNFYNGQSWNGSGTTITDLSGLGNNLTIQGSISGIVKNTNYLTFNGSYAIIPTATVTSFKTTGQTLELLVQKNTNTGGFTRAFGVDSSAGNDYSSISTGGSVNQLYLSNGGTQIFNGNLASVTTWSGNQWTHIVFTITAWNISNTGTVTAYINGSQYATQSFNNLSAGTNPVFIGLASPMTGGGTFYGNIAMARIYNYAIPSTQVTANYNVLASISGNPYLFGTPLAVSSITSGTITSSSVILNFTLANGATSYTISSTPTTSTYTGITASGYQFNGLSAGIGYTFTITSIGATGTGGSLTSGTITTLSPAVSSITAGTITSSTIVINFTAATGATSYQITSTPTTITQTTTALSYTFTGLSANTSYTVTITSINASGNGGSLTSGSFSTSAASTSRMYPSAFIPQASWVTSTPTSSTHSTFTYTISGQTYGNGQYICSADVDSGYQSYNETLLFDGKYPDLTPQSTSQIRSYNNFNIVLQLPAAIKLTSYFICGSTYDNRWASSWTLYGSNDGTTYTSLDTQSGQAYQITGVTYTSSQSTAYLYYKFSPASMTNLKQWLLYGISNLAAPFTNNLHFNLVDVASGNYVCYNGTNYNMGTAANAIVFSAYNNSAVYNNSLGGVALQTYSGPNANSLYMRHASYICWSQAFASNNYDFAWLFNSTSTNGIFTIYNWYGGGWYLDIVNNYLQITNNTARQWQVIQVLP
jgi:hypothetical protein